MRQHDLPPEDDAARPIRRTEADETSDTRFGPRPAPEGHRRPREPLESRRIPPHGEVSPDGTRVWPRPSRGAKWLVWGGVGLATAAATAGTVIAARKLADLLADDPPQPRRAAPQPQPRDEPADAGRADKPLHMAAPPRPQPRRNLMQEIEDNTASIANGVENVMRSLTTAVAGFRTVAGQASAIVREFGDAAELVQGLMQSHRPEPPQPARTATDLKDDPPPRDPVHGSDPQAPMDHDPRLHRL